MDRAMKDDDRDTQKMTPIRPEDVEAPVVRKFQYRTDPGAEKDDPDHQLVRGISRARDNRDDRKETIGKLLDEMPDSDPSRVPISATPARPVRIVHKWSMPTWLSIAAISLAVLVLALAVVIASKSKKANAIAATATTTAPVASPSSTATAVATIPSAPTTATTSPAPVVTATTVRTSAPVVTSTASTHPTTTATAVPTAPTATTEHHDTDIVRTPEL